MAKLFANSGDPDQMPHSVASDLGLHCLPITLLQVSQLQWINTLIITAASNSLNFYFIFQRKFGLAFHVPSRPFT